MPLFVVVAVVSAAAVVAVAAGAGCWLADAADNTEFQNVQNILESF